MVASSAPVRSESVKDSTDADGDVVMGGTPAAPAPSPSPTPRREPSALGAAPSPAPETSSSATPRQESERAVPGVHFREEDVLLSLQLLAYLSKYPHVRTFFHASTSAPPSSASSASLAVATTGRDSATPSATEDDGELRRPRAAKKPRCRESASSAPVCLSPPPRHNVFAVVERFTFRPSYVGDQHAEGGSPVFPPEIQYWASTIMRNACRKDEDHGGIRQCANMACGAWERYPREFAKCRRCRKAKYCSKACQSRAWSAGHRYWCAQASGASGTGANGSSAAQAAAAAAAAAAASAATRAGMPQGTAAAAPDAAVDMDADELAANDSEPGMMVTRVPHPHQHVAAVPHQQHHHHHHHHAHHHHHHHHHAHAAGAAAAGAQDWTSPRQAVRQIGDASGATSDDSLPLVEAVESDPLSPRRATGGGPAGAVPGAFPATRDPASTVAGADDDGLDDEERAARELMAMGGEPGRRRR